MPVKTQASASSTLPEGIPYIIANEAAERFSFYGMKAALVIFMTQFLHLMGTQVGDQMSTAEANENAHWFVVAVYLTPLLGAFISDRFWGKYKTIIRLSIVYCLGHATLAMMGIVGPASWWLVAGLGLIAIGGGGIKPCVSAHVGDQFGINNQHLLTKVFNWFYFSINLGAALSNLFIPWMLKWYGPHWAFGIPGVLMALATLVFWLGRNKFVHIPPAKKKFTSELFSWQGLRTLGKLCSIFIFIPVFWALFDQTASSWVFQAVDMDRHVFGIEILPSQIQAANPFLILLLIPLFTYVIYPAVDKIWKLTPLRKIGIGLFITALAFSLSALIQEWIDAGQHPSIGWQFLAYIILTSAEIMVSIVCLEFAYTQAPKSMKSMVMSIFLLTVSLGSVITALVNHYIQTASPLSEEVVDSQRAITEKSYESSTHFVGWKSLRYPGYDGKKNTADDIVTHFTDKSVIKKRDVPAENALFHASQIIESEALRAGRKLPTTAQGNELISELRDPWGNPLSYHLINSMQFRITSMGPDQMSLTQWDTGILVSLKEKKAVKPEVGEQAARQTWIEKRQAVLAVSRNQGHEYFTSEDFDIRFIAGGLYKLEGANYFWFFTVMMLATALIFIPVAMRYGDGE